MRAGVAFRAVVLPLPVRAGVALRAVAFQLAVWAGVALHALVFSLAVGAGVAFRAVGFPLNTVRQGLQSAHFRFTLPCGQGLHATHSPFTLPCGQGLHTTQLCFNLSCEHRFHPIAPKAFADTPARRYRVMHKWRLDWHPSQKKRKSLSFNSPVRPAIVPPTAWRVGWPPWRWKPGCGAIMPRP